MVQVLVGGRRLLLLAVAVVLLLPILPAGAQETPDLPPVPTGDHEMVLDIAFPTRADVRVSDTFHACRSGCARRHQAADLMGQKHWPLYATVDGRVCSINDEPEEDGYGRNITVCGDDGHRYRYLHLNNDTPGTDDGAAGLEHVFAPGMRRGQRVARGQLIAFMGDSGNAEATASHLHLDIMVEGVVNPYGEDRINPFPSLQAARARGEYPDGSAVVTDETERVSGEDRVATAIALAARAFDRADVVVLAPSTSPADALAAGPLAAVLDGPVLTTAPHALDDRVLTELDRLRAEDVVVVGGRIEDAVLDELRDAGHEVEVIAGATRFATAAAVAERVWGATGQVAVEPAPSDDPVPSPSPTEPAVEAPIEEDPAQEAPASPRFLVRSADDQPWHLLDGSTVGGVVRVALDADPERTDRVVFRIDAPDLAGPPVNREYEAPFDLRPGPDGRRWFDARELGPGAHTVTALVVHRDGHEEIVTATWTVAPDLLGVITGVATDVVDWLDGAVDGGDDAEVAPAEPEVPEVVERRALVALGAHEDASRAWPDALLAGYHGALTATPVLLTAPDGLPDATAAALDGVTSAIVVGGEVAIGRDQATAIRRRGADVQRLAGASRYETGLAVVDDLIRVGVLDPGPTWLTTGRNWPDALVAGPVAAARGEVLLLVDGTGSADRAVGDWLAGRAEDIDLVRAVGGEVAVSPTVLTGAALQVT